MLLARNMENLFTIGPFVAQLIYCSKSIPEDLGK